MSCRWVFFDPSSSSTYTFEVNPNEGSTPAKRRNYTTIATTAPRGNKLLFQGSTEPEELQWSGVLLSAAQLAAFETWYDKRHQIRLTDDLGRQTYIYITAFDFKREPSAHLLFKHSYTASATVLDWA